MQETIIRAITGTPWWVWAVFVYLLFLGVRAWWPRVKHLWRMLVVPIIILCFALQHLIDHLTFVTLAVWLISAAIGAVLSWFAHRHISIKVDHTRRLVSLPGTSLTFFVVMTLFISKYYFAYQAAVNPHLLLEEGFLLRRLIIFAFTSGVTIGRCVLLLYKYHRAPQADLP